MHIYRALMNALRAHIIHLIFYTHVEHSTIKNYLNNLLHTHTHTHTHTAMNSNVHDTVTISKLSFFFSHSRAYPTPYNPYNYAARTNVLM